MANDNWKTPPEIYRYYDESYQFGCDVCASNENALHHSNWITEEMNYLKVRPKVSYGEYVWLNPPYSNPLPFVTKAIEDACLGIGCVMLLNHDMTTRWARKLQDIVSAHHVFDERIAFLNKYNEPIKGNNKGQIVLILPPYPRYGKPYVSYVSLKGIFEYIKNKDTTNVNRNSKSDL